VEQEGGQVPQVGQVCRGVGRLPEDGGRVAGEGCVDAGLQADDLVGRVRGRDRGEVVLALLDRAGAERVAAERGGADPA